MIQQPHNWFFLALIRIPLVKKKGQRDQHPQQIAQGLRPVQAIGMVRAAAL
jgi:hypothetical protein